MMITTRPPKKPSSKTTANATTKLVCFSFAAYAKTLISQLHYSDVPVSDGLSNVEFASVESVFAFSFPPDLRSILREGLPIASGFPNWRSSSPQQLHVLVNLPILGLLKQISRRNFWFEHWGPLPDDANQALEIARKRLSKAPVLVPLYRNCYIPATPNEAGNPVFYVDGEDVRILSYDIAGFFQEFEFLNGGGGIRRRKSWVNAAPAWAAKAARDIEFWTEAAEERRRITAEARGAWWSGAGLGACLEEVFWRLREGGWKEEEVREMMMMDGCDGPAKSGETVIGGGNLEEGVAWHVRALSMVLLRAGWTTEDVVYSLDLQNDNGEAAVLDGKPKPVALEFQHQQQLNRCSELSDHREISSIERLMHLQSLEV
ncbi:hypothetical protein PanWU01x14_334710 [Parasponia andersonii]|uniref:Uncharacterized protein n=1 Tax=Parasponia andersonii TaxID=3476 RepID=A0A2P5AGH9_PARAD|nr:hypothetical protein PanWU01x14_334710 [Parasponia andersonii]